MSATAGAASRRTPQPRQPDLPGVRARHKQGAVPPLALTYTSNVSGLAALHRVNAGAATASMTLYAFGLPEKGYLAVADADGRPIVRERVGRASGNHVDYFAAQLAAGERALALAIAACQGNGLPALRLFLRVTEDRMRGLGRVGSAADDGTLGGRARALAVLAIENRIDLCVELVPASANPAASVALRLPPDVACVPLRPVLLPRASVLAAPQHAVTPDPRKEAGATAPYTTAWHDAMADEAAAVRAALDDLMAHGTSLRPVAIQPGLAQALFDSTNFDGQRPLSRARLADQMNKLTHHRWVPAVSSITFDRLPDGTFCLVNGQHRLLACARTRVPLVTMLGCGPAKDLAEVNRHYALFDPPEATRSAREVAVGFGAGRDAKHPLTFHLQVTRALRVVHRELLCNGDPSQDGLMEEVARYDSALTLLRKSLHDAPNAIRGRLLASRPLAVLVCLFHYQPNSASEFVAGIVKPASHNPADPLAVLADSLLGDGLITSSKGAGLAVAQAWNAFCGAPRGLSAGWAPRLYGTPVGGAAA